MQARRREEHRKLVKRAAEIAKEVRKFWAKSQAVVTFAIRERVAEARRRHLDEELDYFVGQSEQFSRLLVARKEGGEAGGALEAGAAAEAAVEDVAMQDGDAGPSGGEAADASDASWSGGEAAAAAGEAEVEVDETTLAAEEALAAAEGGARAGGDEASALLFAPTVPGWL